MKCYSHHEEETKAKSKKKTSFPESEITHSSQSSIVNKKNELQ